MRGGNEQRVLAGPLPERGVLLRAAPLRKRVCFHQAVDLLGRGLEQRCLDLVLDNPADDRRTGLVLDVDLQGRTRLDERRGNLPRAHFVRLGRRALVLVRENRGLAVEEQILGAVRGIEVGGEGVPEVITLEAEREGIEGGLVAGLVRERRADGAREGLVHVERAGLPLLQRRLRRVGFLLAEDCLEDGRALLALADTNLGEVLPVNTKRTRERQRGKGHCEQRAAIAPNRQMSHTPCHAAT